MECLFITEEPFIIVGSIRGYSCTRQIRTNIVIACDIADGIFDLRIIFTSPAGLKIDFFGGKCIESIYRTVREKVGDRKYADCRGHSCIHTSITRNCLDMFPLILRRDISRCHGELKGGPGQCLGSV